jgi:hypothetical protein
VTKTLEQFKADTLGGRFGVPGTNNTVLGDPAYAGQCVSYVRLYMEEVLGIKTAVWGHAVSYWTNPAVLKHFTKVATPQDGDVVVWGDDAGNWTGPEGHIAIWHQGQLLNQNYGGNLKVTISKHFTQGLLGYLRPKNKGGEIMDAEDAKEIYRTGLHREPENDQVWRPHVGRKFADAARALRTSEEWLTQNHAIVYFAKVEGQKNQLEQRVAELDAQLKAIPSDTKEAEKKLQTIKDALGIK